jgi:hypothetical protein
MMTILGKGLSWLVGSNLIAPAALLAALTLGHQWWLERDARLRSQGATQCETAHELALVKAQRDQARNAVEAAVKAAHTQEQLTETMRNERQEIATQFEAYKASASSDPRCLSDGVLDLLRGSGPDSSVGKR